ncbi:hypothetical protein [Haladaptatus salinisoli]|uniref:hypothetical protein n=1 Tax=Haladaptatus salinisoli TaxID=2884876 RepID=UPI001D09FB0A|nr:hypothetical protein [Haladaptatus salinisoli]
MAHSGRISERSFPLPPWARTPFVVAGLAALALGWRCLGGLLALGFGSGGRVSLGALFLFLVVAAATLVGVALVSTGLVIPGASRVPGVPELAFSRRRRVLVARGAALSVVGPFVGVLVSVLFSPLPGDSVLSPLATLPVSLGWALVLFGLGGHLTGELHLPRLLPATVSESLASIPLAPGRARAATVRTLLVVGGAPVVVAGMATVFVEWRSPVAPGSVEFAVASLAFHLGLVLPDPGPRSSALSLVRSPAADGLTFLGGLVAAASPFLLSVLVALVPVSSLVFARSDFVLLGWALVLLGANERYRESGIVGSRELRR